MALLDPEQMPAYLKRRGVLRYDAQPHIEVLGGGVSGLVVRVDWAEGSLVIKQARPQLQVAADWEFDPSRIRIERDCMEALGELLPGATPRVVFFDESRNLLAMTVAPDGGTLWKDANLEGRSDPAVAEVAARLLAEMQGAAAARPALAETFADPMPLEQGRVHPFHETVLRLHPDLREPIAADIARLRTTKRTLVHGDFSPKNLIFYPDERVVVLDFETAHWGDPAFDPAFAMSHLVLGAAYHGTERADAFFASVARFWAAYAAAAGDGCPQEEDVVREMGCVLLARVDGKSPVEYLTDDDEREMVRVLARDVLASGEPTVDGMLERARATLRAEPQKIS